MSSTDVVKWALVATASAVAGGAFVLWATRPAAETPRTKTEATIARPGPSAARPLRPRREPLSDTPPIGAPPDERQAEAALPAGTESESLDRVRRALEQGQSLAAVSLLNEYDEAYPEGDLKADAVALRVRALASAGQMPNARKLAKNFLRDHPNAPQVKEIESTVGAGQ